MSVLINLMLKIMLMVGLGVLLKKKGVLNNDLEKGISNLLVTAILPLNIIASSNQELTKESMNGTMFVVAFAFIYYIGAIAIMYLLSRKMNVKQSCRNLMITMGVFANTGFIGFPLVEEIFGTSSIIYAVIYNLFYNIFFYTYGMYLLCGKGKAKVTDILKKPVTIASFLAIILFLGQISLPYAVQSTFSSIGAMTVPLSMFVIGCSIAEIKWSEVLCNAYSYIVSIMRLVIFPLIAYGILKGLHISGTVAGICILITGLPSGSLNVIVAKQEDCEPEFAARAVVQSMIFMVISLPLLFWLIKTL